MQSLKDQLCYISSVLAPRSKRTEAATRRLLLPNNLLAKSRKNKERVETILSK